MGKLKKKDQGASSSCKQGDEKQTKISSFFGNKLQAGQKESALFTKISSGKAVNAKVSGQQDLLLHRHKDEDNSKKQGSKPGVSQPKSTKENSDNEVVIINCDDFQENEMNPPLDAKSPIHLSSECKELKSKGIQNDSCPKQNMTLFKETESFNAKVEESITLNVHAQSEIEVPEPTSSNCILVTPDKKIQNTKDWSPDVICDTPGVDHELERSRTRRKQLYASRSFLCSSDRVSVQPGLKPAHLRAQRKVRPSKLLGKVSVSFNSKSKSESSSTSSPLLPNSTDITDVVPQQNNPLVNNDAVHSIQSGTSRDGITHESSDRVTDKPLSIPETQLDAAFDILSTRAENIIEQYFSDEDEPPECSVFDQSSYELDVTVDKYLAAMESLESADIGTDKVDEKLSCGTEISQFPKKSMSWDRTEVRVDKEPPVNNKLPDNGEFKNLKVQSKLLGALKDAEVRTMEEDEEETWSRDKMMDDVTLTRSGSGSADKDTTPVKIYPGKTVKVKRLARAGESPLSKRTHSLDSPNKEKNLLDGGNNDSMTSCVKKVLSYDSHPAKISTKRCHKFTRHRATEFGLKHKENTSPVGDITLKDDRLLADLLVDLNSPAPVTKPDKDKVVKKHISKGDQKSTTLKSKKCIDARVSKDDEKLLNTLFDNFVELEDGIGEKIVSTSPRKLAMEDLTEPILIEESEYPVLNDNEVCIVVEEDSDNLENIVENEEMAGEEKVTSLAELKTDGLKRVIANSKVQFSFDGCRNENAGSETSFGRSPLIVATVADPAAKKPSSLLRPFELSQDSATLTLGTSKSTAVESKSTWSVCKEDQLSECVCDMLSESFEDEFLAPQPLSGETSKKKPDFVFTDLWNRFSVVESNYHRAADELVLDLTSDRSHGMRQCVLRGFWADTEVKRGDIVNVLADLEQGRYIVDDKKGLVVVNPDILLSGTLVVSAVFCPRKSVLNEQFKGVDKGNVQMLYGSIIHSLFQEVLRDGIALKKDVEQLAVSRLKSSKFLHEMYGHNLTENTVMEEVKQYIPSLIEWLHKHTTVSNNGSRNFRSEKKPDMLVSEIQDIEENIWSPRFGVKGKIDLTVKAKLTKGDSSTEVKVLPLELKTGKASFSSEHKGQVTLYSMMCSDRRDDPQEGILLYLKHGQMQTVPVKPESQSGLIQLRNKLAKDLSRQVTMETDEAGSNAYQLGNLPQPINNERACSKCAHLQTCSIYQRSVEQVERPAGHAMSTLVPQALAHLGDEDLAYFLHWVLCLDVEGQESGRRQLQQIWCSSSRQREKDGECLSNLVITGSELGIPESQSFNEGQGCSLSFSRHSDCQGVPLNSVGLTCGDMVVVSSEDGRLIALATGFVRIISATVVEIVVDRDYLHNTAAYRGLKFRVDRNSSFSTAGYLYTNLARLMNPDPQGSRLRDLIIRKRPPEFELKVSKANLYKVKSVFKPLNKPQRTAILKVLMAKDYVLIKGYPGTGKTSTIVALVKILHLLGLSVLLTSYTHSAVDNILLKLKKEEVPFVRLGRQGRIHPSILPNSTEVLTSSPSMDSVQALRQFYDSYSVVATSCLGVSNHPLFSQRHFDVCIVDEASQVLQPACLAPLFHCRKFVLVGDPKQLPPVVQSKEARKLGMDVSLFAQLDNRGATYDLSLQYRMNRVIMDLSNKLVYDGKLECGDPSVAEQCLKIDPSALEDQPEWVRAALSSQLQKSVVFVDTRQISAPELQDGKGMKNETEASLVLSLLQTLINGQVSGGSIGVISPYRSQVRLLQQMVAECSALASVEVNTVDQYQGRDKGVIVVSFVRSQRENAGELLKDLRRLNVALTRAKYKLILVGNSSVLQIYENLAALLDWLHQSQNVLTIPGDYTENSRKNS